MLIQNVKIVGDKLFCNVVVIDLHQNEVIGLNSIIMANREREFTDVNEWILRLFIQCFLQTLIFR
jgi:hypothetical protein